MGVVVGVDGGNSKTELLAATLEGEPLAYLRGPGSNAHGPGGVAGCVEVVADLVDRARLPEPAEAAVYYLCGADVPGDIAALEAAIGRRGWARRALVDNDTFALLRAGTAAAAAIAVVCGSGINCVGRSGSRVVRYPSLGWETGDWGGAESLGREALSLAARAKDGRGAPTALVPLIQSHFGLCVEGVGEAVHYGRLPAARLGELAPAIARAAATDAVARDLLERLAREVVLLVERALRDLELTAATVVLGGGMLRDGPLAGLVTAHLPAGTVPVVLREPPVLGAALAALDTAGTAGAGDRLRRAFAQRLGSGHGAPP